MAISRRDQAQAQAYVWGRLVTALVTGEADAPENPNRRTVSGILAGVAIMALVVVGFAAYGFVRPGGSTAWRKPGVLIVAKDTGGRYVYVDGRLRPVLNYASARLLLGEKMSTVSVSEKSLGSAAHSAPLGIIGAPDALPAAGSVATQVWTVCAPSGADTTTLSISRSSNRADRSLTGNQALLATQGGVDYLIWDGRRLRVPAAWEERALGADEPGAPVPASWIATIPAGPDLTPPMVDGRGDDGPELDGNATRIGELFTATQSGEQRNYLLQQDGLMPLNPLAYAIVVADAATASLYPGQVVRPTPLSPAAVAGLPLSRRSAMPSSLPAQSPQVLSRPPAGLSWCTRQDMGDGHVDVTADQAAGPSDAVAQGTAVSLTDSTAEAVRVAPGLGGLVVAGRFDQALGNSLYLVTDAGVKYPVANEDSAVKLGYPASVNRPVPASLLALLPNGPALGAPPGQG